MKYDVRSGKITQGLRKRFPDTELVEHGETYLGGYDAYYVGHTYSIKNLDLSARINSLQIYCYKGDVLWLINFESLKDCYSETLEQFHKIMATFNFR